MILRSELEDLLYHIDTLASQYNPVSERQLENIEASAMGIVNILAGIKQSRLCGDWVDHSGDKQPFGLHDEAFIYLRLHNGSFYVSQADSINWRSVDKYRVITRI